MNPGGAFHRGGDRGAAQPDDEVTFRKTVLGRPEKATRGSTGGMLIRTLRAGDIDGDIQLLLGMGMPYEARANTETLALPERGDFEELLTIHPRCRCGG